MLQSRIVLVFSFISACFSRTPLTVKSNVGSIVGFKEYTSVDGEQKVISKFLGIPFAESTTGSNRFRKPIPKAPFNSTFDARNVPFGCYQATSQDGDEYKSYGVLGYSEDCLTLNIYVPHDMQSRDMLPVMVWIYGGGFMNGAASIYKPEALALFGNVIVVTVNYRVGMFGFLRDKNGVLPGNQGLWDQHLAIKWVHKNIDGFLGYKDEITIFGESAGGASVLLQAIYPGNNGLFKRVIAESGAALASWAVMDASDFEIYLDEINCHPDTNTFVNCLQSKDPESLQSNVTFFAPVVDHDFLIDTPEKIVRGNATQTAEARDFFASLDIVVGVNNLDGALYFPYFQQILGHDNLEFNISKDEFKEKIAPWMIESAFHQVKDNDTKDALKDLLTFIYIPWKYPDNEVMIRNHVVDFVNDAVFFYPAIQTVDAHVNQNRGNTFLYEFAFEIRGHVSWMKGSNHFEEVPFVFGVPLHSNKSMFGLENITYTEEEKQVSRAVIAFWTNFAKSGNPNFPMDVTQFFNTTWPMYSMTSQRYIRIASHMSPSSVKEEFYPKRMAFWASMSNIIE